MRSSVETLRDEARQLWAGPRGSRTDLTDEQRQTWVPLRAAVIEAQIAEDEYLNSLLDHPLTDEERQKIVDDLYDEAANSEMDPDAIDFAHESDFNLVKDHDEYVESLAVETARDAEAES